MKIETLIKSLESDELEITCNIDEKAVNNGFSHEFGFENCLEMEFNDITDLTINGKEVNYDKLRVCNQQRIDEAVIDCVNEIDVKQYMQDEKDYYTNGDI